MPHSMIVFAKGVRILVEEPLVYRLVKNFFKCCCSEKPVLLVQKEHSLHMTADSIDSTGIHYKEYVSLQDYTFQM